MSSAVNHSFGGGVISPTLWGRSDHERYSKSLKKNRNAIIARDGSWMNRSGTEYVGTALYPSKTVRLVPFEISTSQAYVLEFGDQYIHFIKNGSYIYQNSYAVLYVTNANPGVFTFSKGTNEGITSANVANGMMIEMSQSVVFPSALALMATSRFFLLANVNIGADSTTFTLTFLDGTAVNTTSWGTYTASDLTINVVYSVATTYAYTDLAYLKFDQSVDVMTLTLNNPGGSNYPVQELSYFSDTTWTLQQKQFWPDQIPAVLNLAGSAGAAGSNSYFYMVTTVNLLTGEESYPGMVDAGGSSTNKSVSNVALNTSGVAYKLTSTSHGLNTGNDVQFNKNIKWSYATIDGTTTGPILTVGKTYSVTVLDANHITVNGDSYSSRATSVIGTSGLTLSIYNAASSQYVLGMTADNPILVTTQAANSISNGDVVLIKNTGIVGLDNNVFIASPQQATEFVLIGINGANYSGLPFTGTGQAQVGKVILEIPSAAAPTNANPNELTWSIDPAQGDATVYPISFNIYGMVGGVFGFIGTSNTTSFDDPGITPNTSVQPPQYNAILIGQNNNPSCSIYYQQRHCFANTSNSPDNFWGSAVGFFDNFSDNTPVSDSDAVIFSLASSKVDPIQNMLDIGNLIIFTQNSEYAILGNNTAGQFGELTPTAINAEIQSFHGCANVRPVRVDGSAIYLQSRGNILRDLNYSFEEDKYKGNDLTVFAKNLFDNYSTVDMDFAETPNSLLHTVRNDGKLIPLTYVKEQQILAWGVWDSPNGNWENVVVIPENGQDTFYYTITRLVLDDTGTYVTKRQIERLQTRIAEISNQSTMIFMDSAGTYNGTNTSATTMTLSGGNTWGENELLTLTSSVAYFNSSMVGQQIQLTDSNGVLIRGNITAYTSSTVVTVLVDDSIPQDMRNTALTTWALAVNQINGLWWLNGLTVSVTGDGYVVASPYNSSYKQLKVVNGQLTLPTWFSIVNVGIPYKTDLKTLDMDVVGFSVYAGKTAFDKWKNISEVTALVVNTRGGFYGSADPDDVPANSLKDPLFKLYEMKGSSYTDNLNVCQPLITDNIKMSIEGGWDIHGNVFVRQVDPLPICISALAYAGNLPLRDAEAQPQQGLPK